MFSCNWRVAKKNDLKYLLQLSKANPSLLGSLDEGK